MNVDFDKEITYVKTFESSEKSIKIENSFSHSKLLKLGFRYLFSEKKLNQNSAMDKIYTTFLSNTC